MGLSDFLHKELILNHQIFSNMLINNNIKYLCQDYGAGQVSGTIGFGSLLSWGWDRFILGDLEFHFTSPITPP